MAVIGRKRRVTLNEAKALFSFIIPSQIGSWRLEQEHTVMQEGNETRTCRRTSPYSYFTPIMCTLVSGEPPEQQAGSLYEQLGKARKRRKAYLVSSC